MRRCLYRRHGIRDGSQTGSNLGRHGIIETNLEACVGADICLTLDRFAIQQNIKAIGTRDIAWKPLKVLAIL